MADGDRTLTSCKVTIKVSGSYKLERDYGGNVADPFSAAYDDSLTNGVGDDQSDRVFKDQRAVVAGTPDDLDLAGGSLLDVWGKAFSLAEVSVLMIEHVSGAGDLLVGGAGAINNAWVGPFSNVDYYLTIPASGLMGPLFSPKDGDWAVVAGTGDILRFRASTGTVTYNVMIVGRST